jgi:hypothetical protein
LRFLGPAISRQLSVVSQTSWVDTCKWRWGSASELEYHLLLVLDLKMLTTPAYELLHPG